MRIQFNEEEKELIYSACLFGAFLSAVSLAETIYERANWHSHTALIVYLDLTDDTVKIHKCKDSKVMYKLGSLLAIALAATANGNPDNSARVNSFSLGASNAPDGALVSQTDGTYTLDLAGAKTGDVIALSGSADIAYSDGYTGSVLVSGSVTVIDDGTGGGTPVYGATLSISEIARPGSVPPPASVPPL